MEPNCKIKAKCSPDIVNYVCGSDGVTYVNQCILNSTHCNHREVDPNSKAIVKVSKGPCPKKELIGQEEGKM